MLHGGTVARFARAALLAVGLGAILGACGGSARAPRRPAATTEAAVAQGDDYERARRHDLARAAYERAVREAPDPTSEAYARLELASALEAWNEVPAAITQLEAVVRLDPRSAHAWHDLGILRHHQGDAAGAEAALRRAVDLAPSDPRPRIALAALLWQRGDLAAARAEYRALLGLELPDRVREKVEWAIQQLSR